MRNRTNPKVRDRSQTGRTLNVVKITVDELREHWGVIAEMFAGHKELFIRCNKWVEINWDKAPVYTWSEIQTEQKKRIVAFRVPKEVFELP